MSEWEIWDWPFFEEHHLALADKLKAWQAKPSASDNHDLDDLGVTARSVVEELADWGFLDFVIPKMGTTAEEIDVRAICLIREALAYRSALADNMFVMQGLATAPLWLSDSPDLAARYLDPCRKGKHIAAFAVTEPDVGTDVASLTTSAKRDGDHYVLNGVKLWITNGNIADHYIVVARTGEAPGSRGLSAFIVDRGTPGLLPGPQIEMIAAHPISEVRLENCRVPASQMVGGAGAGFKAAMSTFDIFRSSVGAAAIGLGRHALDAATDRVRTRQMFGRAMSEMETVQAKIADMALDIESGALLVYKSAWARDVRGGLQSLNAAMAKLGGTEAAQRVADAAVQLFGGLGVSRGCIVEQIYRDIRPMRIYEGASEVQKIVIARNLLK